MAQRLKLLARFPSMRCIHLDVWCIGSEQMLYINGRNSFEEKIHDYTRSHRVRVLGPEYCP